MQLTIYRFQIANTEKALIQRSSGHCSVQLHHRSIVASHIMTLKYSNPPAQTHPPLPPNHPRMPDQCAWPWSAVLNSALWPFWIMKSDFMHCMTLARVCVHACVGVRMRERLLWLYEWVCAVAAFAVVCQYAKWVGEGSTHQMHSAD